MRIALVTSVLLALATAGCTSTESVYRGLYHGLQVREDPKNPSPSSGTTQRRPAYEEYQADRLRRLLRAD
jgi:hypothetical protein